MGNNPFRKTASVLEDLSEAARIADLALKEAQMAAERADNLWAEAAAQEGISDAAVIYAAKCESEWQTAQREVAKRQAVARLATERLETAKTEAGLKALKAEIERKEADRAAALAILAKRTKAAHKVQKLVSELEGTLVELVGHGNDMAEALKPLGLALDVDGFALNRGCVTTLLRLEMFRTPSGLLDWANQGWSNGKPAITEFSEVFERMDRAVRAKVEATRG